MRFACLFEVTAAVQQCTIKIRLYAEAGDTTRETRHMIWDGRREGSCRQVPGLAAKTEEDERRHTGKRMVDLTLNVTFWFLDLYLKCGKGEMRRAGAI